MSDLSSKTIILVIDDDDLVREYLVDLLSSQSYMVISAETGNEGLDMFVEHKPDLVVTDLIMPEKEGIETITAIRNFNQQIPIIAISGFSDDYLRAAQRLGASATFRKPLDSAEFLSSVAKLVNQPA